MSKSYLQRQLALKMSEAGYNMKSLSQAAGRNETYVRDILEGRVKNPSYASLRQLADVLGCSVQYLTEDHGQVMKERSATAYLGQNKHQQVEESLDPDHLIHATLLIRDYAQKNKLSLSKQAISTLARKASSIAAFCETDTISEPLIAYLTQVHQADAD